MQGARVYSRGKFGSLPGSEARALGVLNRASWQVVTRLHSASSSLAGQRETPQFNIVALLLLYEYYVYITPCLKLSSSVLGGSHGTAVVAHQARLLL